MTMIVCSRCGETKPQLLIKPPGKYGVTLQEKVCEDCWNEWREMVPKVINHYGLNLGIPEDRVQLQTAMLEFLLLTN